jgi:PhzF family phenazine biosynthesis protein
MSGVRSFRFAQVDVFTATPFAGNPVAVVFGAMDVDSATMQRIAQWTNLSETVFVGPPTVAGADYHARIFAQDEELPFAGHPTLGVAHAVLDAGIATPTDGFLRMQCGAGVVDVAVRGGVPSRMRSCSRQRWGLLRSSARRRWSMSGRTG